MLSFAFWYCIVKIWNLGSPEPNFTLEAHLKGVNCVDYFTGGDRPYLITGSDDQTAKVRISTGFFWQRNNQLVIFVLIIRRNSVRLHSSAVVSPQGKVSPSYCCLQ